MDIKKSSHPQSSLFRFKDRFSNLMCSNVIYKYTCSGCDATYYGKTKRHLIVRCREHLGINKAGQKIKSNSLSIGDHISKSGHKASFDDFEIISKTDNHFNNNNNTIFLQGNSREAPCKIEQVKENCHT